MIKKFDYVARNLKQTFNIDTEDSEFVHQINSADAINMIKRLKEKFNDKNTTRAEKIQILTIMPSTWNNKKNMEVMGSTDYMTRSAKELVESNGILSMSGPKHGKTSNFSQK